MASVIRVKRRIDEDPAEALILSCKRQRQSDLTDLQVQGNVLSFAGTITSKTDPVSRHIKEAIRKKKVHKELHPQTSDFKHSLHVPEVTKKLRKQTEQASRTNRYRVTWSRRALDLDCLDKDDDACEHSNTKEDSCSQEISGQELITKFSKGDNVDTSESERQSENKENVSALPQNHVNGGGDTGMVHSSAKAFRDSSRTDRALPQLSSLASTNIESECNGASNMKSFVKEDKMFCIFDLENEAEDDPFQGITQQQSTSGITMNNIPMVSQRVVTPPSDESQFVYDLYYTHNNLSDLDLEAVLTVEALCDDFVGEEQDDSPDRDLVYDESDDSNDENNWRNDYPDEDPRFFENEEEDYDYAEDMIDTNFLNDDEGDLLSYWMDTRCRVADAESDNGEDEYEEEGSSDEEESGIS